MTNTSPDLSAFRAFLEQQRGPLIHALADELRLVNPNLTAEPDDAVFGVISHNVDMYITHLAQPEAITSYLVEQFGPMIKQRGEISGMLRLVAAYRQHFLHYGLEALAQGVEAADIGLKALMRQNDVAMLWMNEFHSEHLHSGIQRQADELYAARDRLNQGFHSSPLATIEWDSNGIVRFWNPSAERIFGWSAEEATGQNIVALLVPGIALAQVQHIIDALLNGQVANSRNLNVTKDGRLITCSWYNAILRNEHGHVVGALSQTEDVSEQIHFEDERSALQQQVIEAQAAVLRELSTPLIPLADGVVALPLIGSIDTARAQQVLESLLQGVSKEGARIAILDITGVPIVDTQVANALLQAAQAVRLLGAQVILTGIRPEVAQTLVGLGVDFSGLVTLSTLQSGITYAFQRMRVSG